MPTDERPSYFTGTVPDSVPHSQNDGYVYIYNVNVRVPILDMRIASLPTFEAGRYMIEICMGINNDSFAVELVPGGNDIASLVAQAGSGETPIDLSGFVTKTELAQAVQDALPNMSLYATDQELANAISGISVTPDLTNYATKTEVSTEITNATSSLATKTELQNAINTSSSTSVGLYYTGTSWPPRPSVTYPVLWISTKNVSAPMPSAMVVGDMWIRHPDSIEPLP